MAFPFLRSGSMIRLLAFFTMFLLPHFVSAEQSISIYGGVQTSPHSSVSGVDENNDEFDFLVGWEGNSLEAPPYYGLRYTRWSQSNSAISLDFSHAKVYADHESLDKSGFEVLQFTDGLNILTANYLKRYSNNFYWGVGAGVTLPHVEVQTTSTGTKTFEYQFGGYAVQTQFGYEKRLTEKWSVFGEYKFNYTINDVDLKGGGRLKTNIVTNAVNLGVSYKF